MKQVTDSREFDAKSAESSQIKISIAALVLRNGGEIILDPPFVHEGCPIQRIRAHNKMVPARLAYHDEKLGGSLTPGFRMALYTTKEHCSGSRDMSFDQSEWNGEPSIYSSLYEWALKQCPEQDPRNKMWP